MQTGVYNGWIMFPSGVVNFKLNEVAKYYTEIGFGAITWHGLTMNKARLQRLPKEVQDIILEVAKEYEAMTGTVNDANYPKQIEQLKSVGAVVKQLPPSVAQEWATSLKAGRRRRRPSSTRPECPAARCSSWRSRRPRSSATSGRFATRSSDPGAFGPGRAPGPLLAPRAGDMFEKTLDTAARALLVFASVLAFALSFVVVADVVGRVGFNSPLKGTPELVSSTIVIVCYLMASYAILTGGMLRVDAITDRMPPVARGVMDIIGSMLGILLFAIIVTGPGRASGTPGPAESTRAKGRCASRCGRCACRC